MDTIPIDYILLVAMYFVTHFVSVNGDQLTTMSVLVNISREKVVEKVSGTNWYELKKIDKASHIICTLLIK